MSSKFYFDRGFQIGILSLMIQKYSFLVSCADLVKPEYFEDEILVWYFTKIRDYYLDYEKVPTKTVLGNEVIKASKSGRIRESEVGNYLEVFNKLDSPVNEQNYLINEVVGFCRRQEIRRVMLEVAPDLDKTDDPKLFDTIEEKIKKACNVGSHAVDLGTSYFETFEKRIESRLNGDDRLIIPTGITELDYQIGGGVKSGQMLIWVGGCHRKGQPILMYDGSVKKVEDVLEGDQLMGPGSQPRNVLKLAGGYGEMVEIVPNKGDPFVVNMDHILTLVRTNTQFRNPNAILKKPNKDGEIIDVSVREYLTWSKSRKHVYKLFRDQSNFTNDNVELPIDPYFLGLLIGDGNLVTCPKITTMDKEIREEVYYQAQKIGYTVNISSPNKTAPCYSIAGTMGKENIITKHLRSLDLWGKTCGDKFIPHAYKVSSRENRLQILAGLIDTDGSMCNRGFDFISKSQLLANDVTFLARSVGLAAYTRPCKKYCQTGGGGTYYRVSISGDTDIIPCRLPRKKAPPRVRNYNTFRTGFKVNVLEDYEDYYGFELDQDGRYLLGDFTVTHNTNRGKSIALSHCGKRAVLAGHKVMHYTLELNEDDIAERYDASWSGVRLYDLNSNYEMVQKKLGDHATKYGNQLKIKFFPMKTASIDTIKAHLHQLMNTGWIPDLVVIDYGDLLKPTTSYRDEYADLGAIFADLKGLAGTLHIPLITATQTNRSGLNADIVDLEHTSDSFKKVMVADMVIGICATEEEYSDHKARLFISKNRNGPRNGLIPIRTAFDRMSFYAPAEEPYELNKKEIEPKVPKSVLVRGQRRITKKD
jgi:replicative DNA helicase